MATRSRARHFHATAKALNAAASARVGVDSTLLGAQVSDVDIQSIIAGASLGHPIIEQAPEQPVTSTIELPESGACAEELRQLHEELRWAESKLMQASERLAEAQEARRKDLVALAVMRRELMGSFTAERRWLTAARGFFAEVHPVLTEREADLARLVEGGVRTQQVIVELASVRAERKLFEIALVQTDAQLARIDDNEASSEYQVASEAYDREPDGASMRELARLRASSSRLRRQAQRMRSAAGEQLEQLGLVPGMGEVTAANAFLAAEHEGETRAAERMDRVRAAQAELELSRLPEPEAAIKAAIKHPVHFLRARRGSR